MITVSLNEIKAHGPCKDGWKKLKKAKGGKLADRDAQFPMTDIMESNGIDDALWCLRARPEHDRLWRKYAVWCARQAERLMTDERSQNALDVAWKHSEGMATDAELREAWDAAGAAAWDAAGDAAWAAAWDAERNKQKAKLIQILTAGEWVE